MEIKQREKKYTRSWRSELLQILLICLVGGAFQEYLLESGYKNFSNVELYDVLLNGSFWVLLWKGSEYQVLLLNRMGISWESQGILRVILSLIITIIYVIVVVTLIYVIFLVVFGDLTLDELLPKFKFSVYWPALIMTIAISTFMHGRGFWIEWRRASQERENYRIESANFRFQALKNQVNPHFLFNSLNVLSSLVYDDQKKAVEFIRKLSEVYRYVLDRQEEELVLIGEELDFIKSFVFLQKIRFGESLSVSIEGKANGYIPPIALQILIENAIKHNIVSESKPLHVSVSLTKDSAIVENNIQEKLTKDSTGIGLANLKSRYEYLTDRKLIIENDDVRFRVVLPLLKIKP